MKSYQLNTWIAINVSFAQYFQEQVTGEKQILEKSKYNNYQLIHSSIISLNLQLNKITLTLIK